MSTKRELQEENETLRQKLEEIYDAVGDALGFEDDGGNDDESEDGIDDEDGE